MKKVLVALAVTVLALLGLGVPTSSTASAAAPSTAVSPRAGDGTAAAPTTWRSVSTGGYTSCGIDTHRKLWCWGYNEYGQLGNGTQDSDSHPTPTKVDGSRWLSIDVSYSTTCGIKADRTAWCWGYNGFGNVGNGDDADYVTTPAEVSGSISWARIAPGYESTCGISTRGGLYCWGLDADGGVGDGDGDTSTSEPRRIEESTRWGSVTSGYYGSCAVSTDRRGYCWGDGSYGQNGDGGGADVFSPVRLPGRWKNLETHAETVCGVTSGNVSKCWGYNEYGQVGDGGDSTVGVPTTLVAQSRSFRTVHPGYVATCAVRSEDRALRCFGYNGYGQFGDGTYDDSSTPVPGAGGKTGWTIVMGDYTTCGLRGGKLFCWGYNGYGQAGVDGGTEYLVKPTRVGSTVVPERSGKARAAVPRPARVPSPERPAARG